MKTPDSIPRPTDPNSPANPDHRTDATPREETTGRMTTDGTRALPDTYFSTDGTRELPDPMIDPMTGRRGFQTDWPLGDPRRGDPAHLVHTTGNWPGAGPEPHPGEPRR